MKRLVYIVAVLLCWGNLAGQKLSAESEISLLTCAKGEELYSLFGHSALRVKDSSQGIDLVFNYGTFNFQTPNFYSKFARGKLDYLLSVADYERFIATYKREKRSVYAQQLQLTQTQKQALFDALLHNYQPENRAYKYDFFMDNCATRIDEIIKKTIKGKWEYHPDFVPKQIMPMKTYRTGIAPYLQNSDWLNLGLNIILGMPTDERQKGLFLPKILQQHYAQMTLNGKPIVGETQTLYEANYRYSKTNFWLSPLFLFSVLAVFLLIVSVFFSKKLGIIDFLLFGITGIAGCIMAFLWFGADHTATNENWNIIWALPTHLPMAFLVLQKKKTKFVHYYFLITCILDCLFLLFMVFPLLFAIFNYLPFGFPFYLLIPLLLCLIIRSLGIVLKKS